MQLIYCLVLIIFPLFQSYMGQTPQVYIADPELIRLVFVKDFVHFGDRQDIDLGSPVLNEILDFQPGNFHSVTVFPINNLLHIK